MTNIIDIWLEHPMLLIPLVAVVLLLLINVIWGDTRRRKDKKLREKLDKLAVVDRSWSQVNVMDNARKAFLQYRKCWNIKNFESMKEHMTEECYVRTNLLLKNFNQINRIMEITDDIKIHKIFAEEVDDRGGNGSALLLRFEFSGGEILMQGYDSDDFYNIRYAIDSWRFVKIDKIWKLASVSEDYIHYPELGADTKTFFRRNDLHYGPDWLSAVAFDQWRLLGDIGFRDPSLNISIYDHAIGNWGNNNSLVQLYACRGEGRYVYKNCVVAQINLSKSYGNIVIQRKKLFPALKMPKEYKRAELPQENKHYRIFTTDVSRAIDFELLSPAFLAWLESRDVKINIEVVGNVVYLYRKIISRHSNKRYPEMMEVLKHSYKELRL